MLEKSRRIKLTSVLRIPESTRVANTNHHFAASNHPGKID